MFLVLAILTVSVILGLSARRFGPFEELLLVSGIGVVIALQYFAFGPS